MKSDCKLKDLVFIGKVKMNIEIIQSTREETNQKLIEYYVDLVTYLIQ